MYRCKGNIKELTELIPYSRLLKSHPVRVTAVPDNFVPSETFKIYQHQGLRVKTLTEIKSVPHQNMFRLLEFKIS